MMIDATGPTFPPVYVSHQPNENETGISSNDRGGSFSDVISAADQPLYSESENHSQLSAVARLRLYASNTTTEHMSWHATHETENGVMCHPSDAEALKYFNETHPDFDLEHRNVRLGLCADGFAPHGQYGKSYSSGHPYRRNKKAFMKGRVEKNEAPPRANGEEVWHSMRYFKSAIEEPLSYPPGYGTEHKWTKRSILWDLPYWTTNMI
ncbi:UNVERIFIED_CONTAM: hypothetical protein Sradi_2010200 [Sesamum radiatum]|uniref:Uncharacterized protein n=1 Tax=Sesamum radiatum TaxID=300843 RepID=A0AAW2TGA2_SESRA